MRVLVLMAALILSPAAQASEPVLLHAAGSLRGALTEITEGFSAEKGLKVIPRYGASGLLKDAIAGGDKAEAMKASARIKASPR